MELKLYRGYANREELVISGHAFSKYPTKENLYERKGFKHLWSILQLFSVKTIDNIRIVFRFGNLRSETRTLKDGYFRFTIPLPEGHTIPSGWHSYEVSIDDEYQGEYVQLTRRGELLFPPTGAFVIISDIDDTFLISYSSRFFMKLYVMLTKNVNSRKPHADVAKHYRLLSHAGNPENDAGYENMFFFVSSSEWNLYDYIVRFTERSGIPKAIIKLKKIKDNLTDFFGTGGGSHNHKQRKIEHVIEFYPRQKFILLGDDSQRDSYIYENICKLYPNAIHTIYIRQVGDHMKSSTQRILANVRTLGINTCYFRYSTEAILHSVQTGLITENQIEAFEKEEQNRSLEQIQEKKIPIQSP